jgi:hypothetical protein
LLTEAEPDLLGLRCAASLGDGLEHDLSPSAQGYLTAAEFLAAVGIQV